MRTRISISLWCLALVLTSVGCSSDDDSDSGEVSLDGGAPSTELDSGSTPTGDGNVAVETDASNGEDPQTDASAAEDPQADAGVEASDAGEDAADLPPEEGPPTVEEREAICNACLACVAERCVDQLEACRADEACGAVFECGSSCDVESPGLCFNEQQDGLETWATTIAICTSQSCLDICSGTP